MADEVLSEALDFSSAKVDAAQAIIHGVKLSGRASRNKRKGKKLQYSDAAIQQSVKVFENCPVSVRGGHDRQNRDYTAQNGVLRAGRAEALGTDKACSRFDWHLNPKDPLTEKILYDAEHFPGNLPLSQEVMQWTEEATSEGVLVTSITDNPLLVGVAAVYRGGLNDSLFEHLEKRDMEIKTKEELAAQFPALCEELTECACRAARSETDQLKAKLEEAIAAREAAVATVKDLETQLGVYRQKEEVTRRSEEIRTAALEICGETYQLSDELLEDLLALYDGERYKRLLGTIAGASKAVETEQPPVEEPTSTSGIAGKSNGKVRATRVGLHNRL